MSQENLVQFLLRVVRIEAKAKNLKGRDAVLYIKERLVKSKHIAASAALKLVFS